jgi:IMP cyclohydrolase
MYIGRYLVVDADRMGYRVSSRSFPARTITAGEEGYRVVPTADAEETTNPYVSYTCLRAVDGAIVGGNGSHVDTVAEKLARGYPGTPHGMRSRSHCWRTTTRRTRTAPRGSRRSPMGRRWWAS